MKKNKSNLSWSSKLKTENIYIYIKGEFVVHASIETSLNLRNVMQNYYNLQFKKNKLNLRKRGSCTKIKYQ